MTAKKALSKVIFWVTLALCFNAGIYYFMGKEKALSFLAGYVLEQSLSVDNLFLFLMVFSSFGISEKHQGRVLKYGILGAVILRFLFVVAGVAVVTRFHAILYVFGVNLIVSGIRMAIQKNDTDIIKDSKTLKFLRKMIPITSTIKGQKFFVRGKKSGRLLATPLFAVLIMIEFLDIIFAVDSIPAIFSITTDLFIVYTSNIFAILNLRSMFFLLEKLHRRFRYVKYGVATILTFTGIKLTALMFHIEIPVYLSLTVIFSIMAASILASLILT